MNNTATEKTTSLPRDPAAAMQEMMSAIDNIRGVYTRETEALVNFDTQSFLALQDEKLQAARRYQQNIEEMMERREEMKNINPLMKKRLFEMQREFSGLTRRNIEALERMQRTVSRFGETLSQAARDAAKKHRTFSYGNTGKVREGINKTVSMGLSETA